MVCNEARAASIGDNRAGVYSFCGNEHAPDGRFLFNATVRNGDDHRLALVSMSVAVTYCTVQL